MLLGHGALVGFKSPEASAETKAFVGITALPVETSDWFMTDGSAGLGRRAYLHSESCADGHLCEIV